MLDRGANASLFNPRDFAHFIPNGRYVDCTGLDYHQISNLPVGTGLTVCRSDRGQDHLLEIHEGALVHNGQTILSCLQLEDAGCVVHDKVPPHSPYPFPHVIIQGITFPAQVHNGLVYLPLRPPTHDDIMSLPKLTVNSTEPWDPHQYNVPISTGTGPLTALLCSSTPCGPTVDRAGIRAYVATAHPSRVSPGHRRSTRLHNRANPPTPPTPSAPSSPPSGEVCADEGVQEDQPRRKSQGLPKVTTILDDDDDDDASVDSRNSHEKEDSLPDLIPKSRNDDESVGSSDSEDSYYQDMWDLDQDEDPMEEAVPDMSYNNKAKGHTKLDPIPAATRMPKHRDAWYKRQRRFFPGTGLETIKRTFENTTQFGSRGATVGPRLLHHSKSPNPILNIPRRQEDVATDTIYSNTPAVDNGSTAAQFYIGMKSKYRTVRPCGNSDAQFTQTLMDEIRSLGAMNRLISDKAKAQVSEAALDILRKLAIDDWHNETGKSNQNHAEIGLSTTIPKIQEVLNTSGAPGNCWLLASQYICHLENHLAHRTLGWRTPMEWMTGQTPDISVILQFQFYEPVFYKKDGFDKWAESNEALGRFVGFATNIGHAMTYKILTEDNKVIARSDVRTARKQGVEFDNPRAMKESPKLALDLQSHIDWLYVDKEGNTYKHDAAKDIHRRESEHQPILVDASGLLNRTFISNPDENGEQHRTKIIGVEDTSRTNASGTDPILKFKVRHGEKTWNEIVSYNKMLEWCERDEDKDDHFRIEEISNHRKAIMDTTAGEWEVLVQWANGETSWEPLSVIFTDDPVSVSMYALKNGLLNTAGWKRCKNYTKNVKKFARMVNQTTLRSNRLKPVYKYGFQVPRNHTEAVRIDEKNGNTRWQDAEKLEIKQLLEYDSFADLGLGAPTPAGHQRIPCHMVYDVKHDGRHKARFVAGGHRTTTPIDSVYSGVVSLQGIRLLILLAELNDMEPWATDVGNAYLESYTTEKIVFVAGPEFGELEGHTLKVVKALYGLRMSGKCWHDRLFDVLRTMGFTPSRAEPDIWMRAKDNNYEYIAVYVDDLLIVSRDPKGIILALEDEPHKFKLKGTGPLKHHLGCDYFRDEDGTLCAAPKMYIQRMKDQYETMFGEKPRRSYKSPLDSEDHPELDDTPLMEDDGVTRYQSVIGTLQWAVTLGRFDIAVALATMSSFNAAPRNGHMERLKRMVGYLVGMKDACIRIRTHEPDFSDIPHIQYDWARTVYGNVKEVTPRDAPKPLGNPVVTSSWVDANLMHCHATGRSMNGVLHFVNATPIDWYAKKQATVETATYGSEFVAARNAVQQIMGLRTTLMYLGVPVRKSSYLFGDNNSVVTSSTIPHSPNKKRHHSLSYHFVREAIAAGIVRFNHVVSKCNVADIVSKHWKYSDVWPMLQAVLFWRGDTAELLHSNGTKKDAVEGSNKVD